MWLVEVPNYSFQLLAVYILTLHEQGALVLAAKSTCRSLKQSCAVASKSVLRHPRKYRELPGRCLMKTRSCAHYSSNEVFLMQRSWQHSAVQPTNRSNKCHPCQPLTLCSNDVLPVAWYHLPAHHYPTIRELPPRHAICPPYLHSAFLQRDQSL